MNRRAFLKGLVASGLIVPELILPERQIWALGGVNGFNAPPRRPTGDDTAWVNWHVANDLTVPPGRYDMYGPLLIANKRDAIIDGHGVTLDFHGTMRALVECEDLEDCTIKYWTCLGEDVAADYFIYTNDTAPQYLL